eukprot:CAMPEP_0201728734 /NCGR_PEP_ID=MMETSP0593-20130828/16963_1 /ASSEMBLY_ACC=CAM_ASM_000672 /TAXON_ID=267983 /ORGANISM="Skeletonema japonicum, Strain CCMP2506" /LENGTH=44 /DNA_ID= /DNA_START= /DNA_END= /DNA_ORIENTATION=
MTLRIFIYAVQAKYQPTFQVMNPCSQGYLRELPYPQLKLLIIPG